VPPLTVEAESYEGTLERLISLVRECRIELAGIPLAPICDDYIGYLRDTGCVELDGAAAGMFGLAYLIERKAWGMMPEDEEPEDPAELDPALPTAPLYGPAIDELNRFKEERDLLFFRGSIPRDSDFELPRDLSGVRLVDLAAAFRRILARAAPDADEEFPIRRRVSLVELIKQIRAAIAMQGKVLFDHLLSEGYTRWDVVWTFLAILEMVRLGFCGVTVEEESIWIWNALTN
jgi:segregation and condensation protein A